MIIGVFGIPGVGKTTFTKALVKECDNVLRFSASELIKEMDGVVNYDDLINDVVKENQSKLSISMEKLAATVINKDIVIELHNVIETKDGPVFVDGNVLSNLGLDKVFFIKKDPSVIVSNRRGDSKKRSDLSSYEVNSLQDLALKYFMEVFKNHDREVISGSDNDVTRISQLFK